MILQLILSPGSHFHSRLIPLSTISQIEQILLLFFFFPLKLPVNSQPQKNMVYNACREPGVFRRKTESFFYIGLISLCILLTALFFAVQLINKRKDDRGTADKITENLLSIRGDSTASWVSSFAIFSCIPFSSLMSCFQKLLDIQGLCEAACAGFHGKRWFWAWTCSLH